MRSRNLSVNWSAADAVSDDDADVAPAVFLSQKFRLGGSVGLRGSPLDVEIFGEEVDRALESVGHDAPEYISDDNCGRLCSLVAMDDQHARRGGSAACAASAHIMSAAKIAVTRRTKARGSKRPKQYSAGMATVR